jgi:phage shock protein A
MKLFDRFVGLLKVGGRKAAHRLAGDLFSEEVPGQGQADNRQAVLDEIRRQVEALQAELNRTLVREENARLDWQAALNRAELLEASADQALRDGHEDAARDFLTHAQAERAHAAGLERAYREAGELRAYWAKEIALMQPRLARLAAQMRQLDARRESLESVEAWDRSRRGWSKQLDALQSTLDGLESRVAIQKDRVAAREELRADRDPRPASLEEGKEIKNDLEP